MWCVRACVRVCVPLSACCWLASVCACTCSEGERGSSAGASVGAVAVKGVESPRDVQIHSCVRERRHASRGGARGQRCVQWTELSGCAGCRAGRSSESARRLLPAVAERSVWLGEEGEIDGETC